VIGTWLQGKADLALSNGCDQSFLYNEEISSGGSNKSAAKRICDVVMTASQDTFPGAAVPAAPACS